MQECPTEALIDLERRSDDYVRQAEQFWNDLQRLHRELGDAGTDVPRQGALAQEISVKVDKLRSIRAEMVKIASQYKKEVQGIAPEGVGESTGSDSEDELEKEPPFRIRPRSFGFSAEAFGQWNERRAAYIPPRHEKSPEHRDGLLKALHECPFFSKLERDGLEALVDAMPIESIKADTCIMKQGDQGSEGYVILQGDAEVYNADAGDGPRGEFIRTMVTGRFFGEMAMMWSSPRTRSVYARDTLVLAKLEREVYQNLVMRRQMKQRQEKEDCIRKSSFFETLDDEQVARIVDILHEQTIEKDDVIIKQGEKGRSLFVVLQGECVAQIQEGNDVQEVKRYSAGDMFGELALINNTRRKATVKAHTPCRLLRLSRTSFERLLGSFETLSSVKYISDPRKSIADFYRPGDRHGPWGARPEHLDGKSKWFAVYRPTSRDAIAKMLNGVAVGKGLNVKGKSAKKNRLSGYVPFMQISKEEHKKDIEPPLPDARIKVFYATETARAAALLELERCLRDTSLKMDVREIRKIDRYPNASGLDVPESVLREAYIVRQDISYLLGWETGRQSEPAFMDMNLHAVRNSKPPEVVLYHYDQENVMNPHGLLIAYAESSVKPVVSDFDTFTVGSFGDVAYTTLSRDQAELAIWSLERTCDILSSPSSSSWTSRWLEVLEQANDEGFHPDLPEYGFGDVTSYDLIAKVVQATAESGAVRHGAECFNFYFPQELDDNYLVVWDGFQESKNKPWEYLDEPELRNFLSQRISEGFTFPLNPVWPVRDVAWWDIYDQLMNSEQSKAACSCFYPPSSGITKKMQEIHAKYAQGFEVRGDLQRVKRSVSIVEDLSSCERADLAMCIARKSKWSDIKTKLKGANMLCQKSFMSMSSVNSQRTRPETS